MHEYSVVQSLLQICLSYLEENSATSVTRIVVSIGQRANMDRTLFISAFEILKDEYKALHKAKMDIITKELLLECRVCKNVFHSIENPTCTCGSKDTHIVQGRDVMLESLELE